MRIRYFLLPAILLSALGAGLSSDLPNTPVEAKCAVASVKSAFQRSKAVFAGEVIAEEKEGDIKKYTFRVDKFWKGDGAKQVDIFVYQTARYQPPFREGGQFLVYAHDVDGQLSVARCSRNKLLTNAEDDLRELGAGKTPK